MPIKYWFRIGLILLFTVSLHITNAQDNKLILRDFTDTIDVEAIQTAAQPLLERDLRVAIYVVEAGCSSDFEQFLQDDALSNLEGELSEGVIAIFFPVPKNRECTFIRAGTDVESKLIRFDPNILDLGLAPYLADRTPRIFSPVPKIYDDTQALARTLDSIDQILWLSDAKRQIQADEIGSFIYDYRGVLDHDAINEAIKPILNKGINVEIFVTDDNSLAVAGIRKYLGLDTEARFYSTLVITVSTESFQWGAFYPSTARKFFEDRITPILVEGMKRIENGEDTYTNVLVLVFEAFAEQMTKP